MRGRKKKKAKKGAPATGITAEFRKLSREIHLRIGNESVHQEQPQTNARQGLQISHSLCITTPEPVVSMVQHPHFKLK